MVIASRLIVALAVSGLFTTPIYADVIPSQYPSKSEAKEKVQSRLTEMGVKSEDARLRAQRLTEEEASFFAQNPDRVQVVGQEPFGGQADLFWWEWVFGILALVGPVVWILALK
jgi:hypothetical protein